MNIVVLGAVGDHPLEEITAIDPSVTVIDARGTFEVEYAETWPTETVQRYVTQTLVINSKTTRTERDALLAEADIVCMRFPFPLDLRARATSQMGPPNARRRLEPPYGRPVGHIGNGDDLAWIQQHLADC